MTSVKPKSSFCHYNKNNKIRKKKTINPLTFGERDIKFTNILTKTYNPFSLINYVGIVHLKKKLQEITCKILKSS